jgi:hypothetical protein
MSTNTTLKEIMRQLAALEARVRSRLPVRLMS